MKPLFSIIIPTLNEEAYLPHILGDLKRQKHACFEVLVMDGKSEDRTRVVAEGFSVFFPIAVHEVAERNVAHQRNMGAVKAQGQYLVFLDADARIRPVFLRRLERFIGKNRGLIFIPSISPDEDTPQTKVAFSFANFFVDLSQSMGKPFSSGGSMIVERHFFAFLGGFAEDVYMSEDHQLVQLARKYGVRAKFLPRITVKMSLRRMKREGQLRILYKYLLTTAQFLMKGKVDTRTIEYEMGGHLYGAKEQTGGMVAFVSNSLTQVKQVFRELFLH